MRYSSHLPEIDYDPRRIAPGTRAIAFQSNFVMTAGRMRRMIVPSWDQRRVHKPQANQNQQTASFSVSRQASQPHVRPLQIALVLLSCFFMAELIAAVRSHSLSLLADAGHVLSDVAALSITGLATWWSSRERRVSSETGDRPQPSTDCLDRCLPASSSDRQSLSRSELLAAFLNAISLVAIALWIAYQAIARFQSSTPEIDSLPMLLTSLVGFSVNCVNACFLHTCCHHNLNLKSAFLHVLADLCSSVGVLVAAIAVAWLHWNWVDGFISLLVSGVIILFALPLLLQSLRLLQTQASLLPASPCNCTQKTGEQLLFPSLTEAIHKNNA